MPENTVTQFRGRSRYGHNSKTSTKGHTRRATSPAPKKIGNCVTKIGCSFCNPTLSTRVQKKAEIKQYVNRIMKSNSVYDN
jgi:hypothetical protein